MRRRAGLALALATGLGVVACGEKQEHISGPSRGDVRALVVAGLAAAGSDAEPSSLAFRIDGPVLRVRLTVPADGPLVRLAASFRGVRAEIEPFCPKPAVLRCRPALRAWAPPASGDAIARSVAALRRFVARTYGERPLVRRRAGVTRLVTGNGELLAAVRMSRGGMALSFGGLPPPRGSPHVASGRLVVYAGADGLAALRPALTPAGRRAQAGVRRLVVHAKITA